MCAFRLYVWRYVWRYAILYKALLPHYLYMLARNGKNNDNAIHSGSLHVENCAPHQKRNSIFYH